MSTMTTNIADRMRLVIDQETDRRGKFTQLASLTGISSESWKSFYYNRQRPNPDMIEAMAQTWPECAFWLTTGIDDFDHGHVQIREGGISELQRYPGRARTAARDLFLKEIQYKRWCHLNPSYDAGTEEDATSTEFLAEIWRLTQLRADQEKSMERLEENTELARFKASETRHDDF